MFGCIALAFAAHGALAVQLLAAPRGQSVAAPDLHTPLLLGAPEARAAKTPRGAPAHATTPAPTHAKGNVAPDRGWEFDTTSGAGHETAMELTTRILSANATNAARRTPIEAGNAISPNAARTNGGAACSPGAQLVVDLDHVDAARGLGHGGEIAPEVLAAMERSTVVPAEGIFDVRVFVKRGGRSRVEVQGDSEAAWREVTRDIERRVDGRNVAIPEHAGGLLAIVRLSVARVCRHTSFHVPVVVVTGCGPRPLASPNWEDSCAPDSGVHARLLSVSRVAIAAQLAKQ